MSPGRAVLLGQLFVNLPALILIFGASRIGQAYAPSLVWVVLIAGFLCAWVWYAFAIARWRAWALERVTDADRLQRLSEISGLLWPKGSVFEKRAFKDPKPKAKK